MRDTTTDELIFLACSGQHDSHAPILSDGRPNGSPRAGLPYGGIGWAELLAMAAAPAAVAKAEAPAIVASTYRQADGRGHAVQRERGRFGLLVLDIDTGGPSFEAVQTALAAVLGGAERLIYSTSGATEELPKWRAAVPLAELVTGADWPEIQAAFFDCIEAALRAAMTAEGADPERVAAVRADRALERCGQIFFLPNVPAARRGPDGQPLFYRWRHVAGPKLRLDSGPIAARLAERAAALAEAERAAAERRAAAAMKTAARLASDTLSPIDAFNARHNVADLLEKYGFENEPSGFSRHGTANWQSPYQRTGYGLRDFGQHWVSLSGADANAGLGVPTKGAAMWGDAFSLFCHFEHQGDVLAAVATYGAELRTELVTRGSGGRFLGAGALATDKPAEAPQWLGVAEAADRIGEALAGALEAVAAGQEGPVLAVAASPGAGKSRVAREVIAARLAELPGDVGFYCPTLDLAEEAAEHFRQLGVQAVVVRGREAARPDGDGPMCQRAGLAGLLKAAGLDVGANICRRKLPGGGEETCPHRAGCPWVEQWHGLPGAPVVRCYSHAHLWLPDSSGRGEPALRVIDESCWAGALGQAEVPLAGWLGLRRCEPGLAADIHQAALDVMPVLRAGTGLAALPYSAEDLRRFAAGEGGGGVTHAGPSATDEAIAAAARMRGDRDKGAGARAAVWRLLAEAKEAGRDTCERVQLDAAAGAMRVYWRKAMPEGPVVVLDADADTEILRALWPGRDVQMVRAELRPVADVVQCADKSFSKRALLGLEGTGGGAELRAGLVGLVRLEVLRQRAEGGGGVLAVASKAVVRQLFADAGQPAPRLGAELHGARWAWYGPATRGLNDWRDFGAVVLIGREELPPEAVAGQARALWGDGAVPLALPAPDGCGAVLPPEAALPVLMADGSARAVLGRAYAEPRLRALQMQHREHGLRQAAERLRLAHADAPKRVLVLSRVPVPGLPVAELAAWADLAPSRFARALAEAALRSGILRTSAAGLAADAPETFPTVKAAEHWLAKEGADAVKYPLAPNRDSLGARGYLIATAATARMPQQRGRATPLLVLSPAPIGPQEARQRAEAVLGPLAVFEPLESGAEVVHSPPEPSLVAHNQTANRPRRRMEPWPLPAGQTPEGALAELRSGILAWRASPAGKKAAGYARWLEGKAVAAPP